MCAERYRLCFTKDFYDILKIHAKIWYASESSEYEPELLFDPINILVNKTNLHYFTKSEIQQFTFCCLLSQRKHIILTQKELRRFMVNLDDFLDEILRLNRSYCRVVSSYFFYAQPLYYNDNYRLAKVILIYFEGYENNLLSRLGSFIREEKYSNIL
ncbi:MAG: hypothetical protein ACSW8C_01665 [bacterium]